MGHGGMSCALKTIRLIMVLFNIVFFFIGVGLLAIGIYVMLDPRFQRIKEFLPLSTNPGIERSLSYLEVLAIFLIVLGSILLVIGFFGCCGAMRQVKLLLTCYGIIIALVIICEVSFTIYFVAFQSNFEDQFVPKLKSSLHSTYEGPLALMQQNQPKPSPLSLAWDFIMYNFKCCGVEGKNDFQGTKRWNRTNPSTFDGRPELKFPLTCCPMKIGKENWNDLPLEQFQSAAKCAASGENVYSSGCYTKLVKVLDSAKLWVIVFSVLILVVEFSTFIFTMILCCRQKKETIYYSS